MSRNDITPTRPVRRPIEWTPARVLVVVLGVITSGLHVYAGFVTGQTEFLLMGAGLFAGVIVFFTVFWNPVLYLIGVIYVTTLVTVWILNGTRLSALGVVDGIVQLGLIVTFLYLFAIENREQPA
ncbi:hypothetical protein CV102_22210 [Natronococcus pandeyae]|uniref:Uncharacterized protein n=1 Tax=Natronococcus pandeyae TaxID=2055836 RepID=A0A8J8Q021_9EURY|nr:hypothetical protein CV102_22210 [Natronococcus pandeyae]